MENMNAITIIKADLRNPQHAEAIVELVNEYARDDMGNGKDLPREILKKMIPGLRETPNALVMLALNGDEAVGVAVCFTAFSTFAARPCINIHDMSVKRAYRGKGIGRKLLEGVEAEAKKMGCCKLTLEVRPDNGPAKHLYKSFGFGSHDFEKEKVELLFWEKKL